MHSNTRRLERVTPYIMANPYEFEPIPITDEMLSRNGWIKKGIMVLKETTRFGWRAGTLIAGYGTIPVKVDYVHQLQNIFRCYGFDNLAENFVL